MSDDDAVVEHPQGDPGAVGDPAPHQPTIFNTEPVVAEAEMTEILRFLVDRLPFLYSPGRFRFTDSGTSTSFGGDAFLTLASDVLRLRLISDRGQLFMDFQSVDEGSERGWYSIDVVQRLITGEQPASAELSADYAEFLETHLQEIERRFSKQEAPTTVASLKDLEKKRAKELFG